MAYFYSVMDARRSKFPQPPSFSTQHISQPTTPTETPKVSRANTLNTSDDEDDSSPIDQTNAGGDRHSWSASLSSVHTKRKRPRQDHHSFFHLPHHRLVKEPLNQSQVHHPVGVFESQRYMNIEKRLHHPNEAALEENCLRLLSESVHDLLVEAGTALDYVVEWLDRTNSERLRLRPQRSTVRADVFDAHRQALERLKEAMDSFLLERR